MLREVFIDFETHATAKLSLRRMSLREYLSRTHVTGFAWAVDAGPVQFTQDPLEHREELESYANDPGTILVAHNTSFDLRVWRDLCGFPWPCRARCSQGLARAAWPAQPGTQPYSLKALASYLGLAAKLDFDAATEDHEGERFEEYNKHDVELCRAIYRRALPRISEDDLRIAELCQRSRELKLIVDPARVHDGLAAFTALVDKNADAALCVLAGVTDADEAPEYIKAAFGWNGFQVKSVKPHVLKALLERELGFYAPTISMKKLEPGRLAANPAARDALKAAGGANRALSHVRRVAAFAGQPEIDCELSEFAAHTYRFASTSTGRGVNLLNLPKHDKDVAKPVRSMFRLPPDLCWVSADAANVEYRIERWLAGCEDMFAADPFLDPYLEFGYHCTGVRYLKTDPVRQIWKMAVLGLGFLMGMRGFANVLSQAFGKGQITLEALRELIVEQSWTASFGKQTGPLMAHCREIGAPQEIGIVAGNVHKMFHALHPEFRRLATWLEYVCTQVSSSPNPAAAIERAYLLPAAPDRRKLNLIYEPGLEGRSIRVQTGEWGPTLVWRDIAPRHTPFGFRLTSQAGRSKGFRALSPNILIENCWGPDTPILTDRGWVPIVTLTQEDRLWDGVEWIRHGGLKASGRQGVKNWNGVWVTPSHRLFTGEDWCPVGELGPAKERAVLAHGRRCLPSSPIQPFDTSGRTATPGWCLDATIHAIARTRTTGGEGSRSAANGWSPVRRSSHTQRHLSGGSSRDLTWIESTMTVGTSPEISAWYPERRTPGIGGGQSGWSGRGFGTLIPPSGRNSALNGLPMPFGTIWTAERVSITPWFDTTNTLPVFDVLNSGPRHQYMVLTDAGPVIAHNCTQACARNAMCKLLLQLEADYPYQLCVHDEIKLLVPRTEADIRRARDALVALGGPGNALGYGNAFMLDPAEITVSASWYDGGVDWKKFWAKPLTPEVLKGLP